MSSRRITELESRLVVPAPAGGFTEDELAGLPLPVQRYLRAAIAPGTPLALSANLEMRGRIKIGRWMRFRAGEVLAPHRGFVWPARVGGLISGHDGYLDGLGAMRWKLAGFLTVAHAEGPDVSRSAAGRAGAEAIWLPTCLLPRFDVNWSVHGEHEIACQFRVDETPIDLRMSLDAEGRLRSVAFDRWGNPDNTGTWGWHRAGGEFSGYATFDGITIPAEGRFGWFFGTDRWASGDFFHYQITDLSPVTDR